MTLANRIGTSLLPFTNPRVVAPPGVPARHGLPNVVVATPMRSGTHVLIDVLLNNLDAYRTRPLYVDLDQCIKQSGPDRDLVAAVASDAGQVVKTHLPLIVGKHAFENPEVRRVVDQAAAVLTVRRDDDKILRSLAQWDRTRDQLQQHAVALDDFWSFWDGRATVHLAFDDLFDEACVARALDQVATLTGTSRRTHVRMPPPRKRGRIYANKTLTRLLGRHAPHINTTIHTLK